MCFSVRDKCCCSQGAARMHVRELDDELDGTALQVGVKVKVKAAAAAIPQPAQPAARWAGPGRRELGRLGHRCRRCCR